MSSKLKLTAIMFALVTSSLSISPGTAFAANTPGELCAPGTGISGGAKCEITKRSQSGVLRGSAIGQTPFSTNTPRLDACDAGQLWFDYTIDPSWNSTKLKPTTDITLLRWFMRKPKTLSMTLTITKAVMTSTSASLIFFETSSTQTTVESNDAPLPAYDGGGEGLLTRAKIVEIVYRETRAYTRQQILCLNPSNNKVMRVLDRAGMPVRGTTPISKYNILGETTSPKLVLTPVTAATYEWANGIYKDSDFNTCESGENTSTRKNISVNATSSTRTFSTTSSRSGGIKIPLGDYLTLGVSSEASKSISVTFTNSSAGNYKRVICVQPKSPGNFSDLRFSGNTSSDLGRANQLKPGMLLSVRTVCDDAQDTVTAPCPGTSPSP